VHYAAPLHDATLEHGALAVYADLTGGDGMKVGFFDRVPIGFLCVTEEGELLSRTTSAGIYELDDGAPPDPTSSSVKKIQGSGSPWVAAPDDSKPSNLTIEWEDDCPSAGPTFRAVIETAPQAKMMPDSRCGDDGFGNANLLEVAARYGYENAGVSESVITNMKKRGERIFISAETWTLPTKCLTRDPFADDVAPEVAIADLSALGLVPATAP